MLKKLFTIIVCIAMILSLTSCGEDSIATVNGEGIDKGYFDFYFDRLKYQLEAELGEDSWENAQYEGKNALEYAKERALQSAIEDYIVTNKAKADKLEHSSFDTEAMKQVKNSWINGYGGEKEFLSALGELGIDEDQFDYMLSAVYYRNSLVDKYSDADDSEIDEYYNKNIAKVKHILIFTIDPSTGERLPEKELEDAKSSIDSLYEMAKSDFDFDALVSEYTDDQNVFYYVGEGYSLAEDGTESNGMVSEFEITALSLEENEISDVIESSYGYHIIKRYANDSEMLEKSYDTIKLKVKAVKFNDIINKWKSEMKIIVNESLYNSYK